MMRDGERLLGSQKTVLAVDREQQVCAVSEGRLRRVAEREGEVSGEWEEREAAGLMRK